MEKLIIFGLDQLYLIIIKKFVVVRRQMLLVTRKMMVILVVRRQMMSVMRKRTEMWATVWRSITLRKFWERSHLVGTNIHLC